MATVRFFKMFILHFYTGSLKVNILKVLFWEGEGYLKEYSVYPFDQLLMLIILDDP